MENRSHDSDRSKDSALGSPGLFSPTSIAQGCTCPPCPCAQWQSPDYSPPGPSLRERRFGQNMPQGMQSRHYAAAHGNAADGFESSLDADPHTGLGSKSIDVALKIPTRKQLGLTEVKIGITEYGPSSSGTRPVTTEFYASSPKWEASSPGHCRACHSSSMRTPTRHGFSTPSPGHHSTPGFWTPGPSRHTAMPGFSTPSPGSHTPVAGAVCPVPSRQFSQSSGTSTPNPMRRPVSPSFSTPRTPRNNQSPPRFNFSTPSPGRNMRSPDSQRQDMETPPRQEFMTPSPVRNRPMPMMPMRRNQPQASRDAARPMPRMGLMMPDAARPMPRMGLVMPDAARPMPRMGLMMPDNDSFDRSYDSAHGSVDDSLDLVDLQNELSRSIDWEDEEAAGVVYAPDGNRPDFYGERRRSSTSEADSGTCMLFESPE